MMARWVVVALFTTLLSCGPSYEIKRSTGVPGQMPLCAEDTCSYLQEFFEDSYNLETPLIWRISNVTMVDIPDNLNAIGICSASDAEYYTGGYVIFDRKEWHGGSIYIDKDWWHNANDIDKRMLIYHEAGHCYLDRPHREGGVHIMNSVLADFNQMAWEDEVKLLFGDGK